MQDLPHGFAGVLIVALLVLLSAPIDPMGRIAGTRLGGPLAADQDPTWTDYGRRQIAVETRTSYGIRHSVTTTSWVADGNLYVPCARCDGKRWPANVARDNRVRLKIDGQIYKRHAIRITDPPERARKSSPPSGRDPASPTARVPHGAPLRRSEGSRTIPPNPREACRTPFHIHGPLEGGRPALQRAR